ncbi:MAG: hypothetical protein BJ554DRAFT_8472, partial [Olpidium bornovanus]
MALRARQTIAKQLARLTGFQEKQVLDAIAKSKDGTQAHYTLPLPWLWNTDRAPPLPGGAEAEGAVPAAVPADEKTSTAAAYAAYVVQKPPSTFVTPGHCQQKHPGPQTRGPLTSAPFPTFLSLAFSGHRPKPQFKTDDLVSSVSSSGHFLNFNLDSVSFARETLAEIAAQRTKYGVNPEYGRGRSVCIDYSSPNIAKPLHAGHLRSTILGGFLKNLHSAFGYKVIGINYLGDWGKQFGLLAVGFQRFGSEKKLASEPIDHLYEVYVKINAEAEKNDVLHTEAREFFRRMEKGMRGLRKERKREVGSGDEVAIAVWKRFRDMTLKELDITYERLGVRHEGVSGESTTSSAVPGLLEELGKRGLTEQEPQGSLLVDLTKYKLYKPLLQKADGTTLYLTRDLAAATQ